VAQLLIQRGVTRVRPLAGGIEAWRDLKFPLISRDVPAVA
jgi:rhodanese-related sulfurtransferase